MPDGWIPAPRQALAARERVRQVASRERGRGALRRRDVRPRARQGLGGACTLACSARVGSACGEEVVAVRPQLGASLVRGGERADARGGGGRSRGCGGGGRASGCGGGGRAGACGEGGRASGCGGGGRA